MPSQGEYGVQQHLLPFQQAQHEAQPARVIFDPNLLYYSNQVIGDDLDLTSFLRGDDLTSWLACRVCGTGTMPKAGLGEDVWLGIPIAHWFCVTRKLSAACGEKGSN
jgi:hypothetical protein